VIASISNADAILVFGPGEAKSELKKRLDRAKFGGHITVMETTDKLTDRQNRGQGAQVLPQGEFITVEQRRCLRRRPEIASQHTARKV